MRNCIGAFIVKSTSILRPERLLGFLILIVNLLLEVSVSILTSSASERAFSFVSAFTVISAVISQSLVLVPCTVIEPSSASMANSLMFVRGTVACSVFFKLGFEYITRIDTAALQQ